MKRMPHGNFNHSSIQ